MTDTTTTTDTPATTTQPWHATIADADMRGFVELKGWDTPDKAVQSYRQLESHIGVPPDRLLKLPEKPDDPAWLEVHKRLGFAAPDDAAGYELDVPEGFNDDYAKAIANKAKELGIPKHMLKGLSAFNNEYVKTQLDAQEKAIEQGVTEARASLKAEWGGQYEPSMALAQRAEAAMKADLGVGDEEMLAMMNASPRAYYKMLAGYGGSMREAPHIDGDGSGSNPLRAMSPDAANARIRELKNDPSFRQRYLDGDHQANAEMTHLLKITTGAASAR